MQLRLAAFALAGLLATGVAAQEDPALTDLFACRLDDKQVVVHFKFWSSPCWAAVDPADVTGPDTNGTATVAISTRATAEICTMNIVYFDYDKALDLAGDVRALDVSISNPQGALIGKGTAAVAEEEGCKAPEPAAE
jgi:hypothetical protein